MIKNKEDLKFYLEADRIALGRSSVSLIQRVYKSLFRPDWVWHFEIVLRKCEYYINTKGGLIHKTKRKYYEWKLNHLMHKLHFNIKPNCFGPGLSIAHIGPIIVNSATKVGSNCRVHVGVNIGTGAGYAHNAPSIGDNVYIGPGAKLFGAIEVAEGIAIGANAVVTKSFHEKYISIGGVPARKISNTGSTGFLIDAVKVIKYGLGKNIGSLPANEVNRLLKENENEIHSGCRHAT